MSNQLSHMCADGLYIDETYTDEDGHSKTRKVKICDHFDVVAHVANPQTGLSHGLVIEFGPPQQKKQIQLSVGDLYGNSAAIDVCRRMADAGLFAKPDWCQAVSEHLYRMMRLAPLADLAESTGWANARVYVLPDAIFGEPEAGHRVFFTGRLKEHRYRTSGTLQEWQEAIGRKCVGNSRLITAVSAGLTGPIMSDANEESGGIHFFNLSSHGKSSTAYAGGSVLGGGHKKGFLRSWRATANGLEVTLAAHNDATLFLDEIGEALPSEVAKTVYMIGNGVGKERAGYADHTIGSAPVQTWRSMVISTGELALDTLARNAGIELPGGAAVRMLSIPADAVPDSVFETHHGVSGKDFADGLREAARRYYGTPFRAWLTSLTLLGEDSRRDLIHTYRNDFLRAARLESCCAEVGRAASRMATIAAAGEMGIMFDILPWQPGDAIEGVIRCFDAWRSARGGDVAHDRIRMVEQVRGFLERYGISRFEGTTESVPDGSGRVGISAGSSGPVYDRAGWRRPTKSGTEFLIQPAYFSEQVCRGFDATAVAKELLSRGYLRRGDGRHLKTSTTIPGVGKVVAYCVLGSILNGDNTDNT